jgi:hypothetical protein
MISVRNTSYFFILYLIVCIIAIWKLNLLKLIILKLSFFLTRYTHLNIQFWFCLTLTSLLYWIIFTNILYGTLMIWTYWTCYYISIGKIIMVSLFFFILILLIVPVRRIYLKWAINFWDLYMFDWSFVWG